MTPREKRPFVVLGFDTTHDALDAEAVLEADGLEPVPIPAPLELGVRCGIAMRIEPNVELDAKAALSQAGINIASESVVDDW